MRARTSLITLIFLLSFLPSIQAQEKEPATYLVSTESWVPYWIVDSNQVTGLFSDVMQEIDKRIPNKISPISPVPIKRAMYHFKNGDIAIECCVNKAWRNAEDQIAVTLWSDTVIDAEEILIFPKGLGFAFKKLSDLKNKQLATILGYGYIGDEYFHRNDVHKNTALITMVAAGRVDGAIIDRYEYDYATEHLAELKGYTKEIEIGPVVNRSELRMRIHRSRPELMSTMNKAIADMKADGTLNKIFHKYVNSIEH